MNVSELSFDPSALTPEAVEAARQIRSSWPDDLINYVFLKEQGRFFAFLQPDTRRRAKFYAVLADREFNLSWMMYYAFVRATIFERIPQVLRHATTVRQVLGPEAIEVYDLHQAVRRFMQVCRTICDYDEHRNDTRPPPFSPELRQPPRRHSVSEIAVEEDHHW